MTQTADSSPNHIGTPAMLRLLKVGDHVADELRRVLIYLSMSARHGNIPITPPTSNGLLAHAV
jgi:hypothetical protein